MMNQSRLLVSALLLSALMCFAAGCGSSDDSSRPKDPVVRKAPPRQPKKVAKSIVQLKSDLSIDDRINFPEQGAPRDESERVAILRFFDALVKLDKSSLQGMLSFADQLELEAMIGSGLEEYMKSVTLVELQSGISPEARPCVICIFEVEMDYQVQMWYYDESDAGYTFAAAETPPNLDEKLSGNWIVSYFALKEKQTEIANQPDEETSYALAGESTISSGSLDTDQDGPPSNPGGPRSPGGPQGPGR